MAKLTNKQKMFCKEYIVDLNATQAAIRAEYSEKTAKVIGAENLTKPYLQEYIQKLMDERSQKVEIKAEDVLNDILDTRNTCRDNMLRIDETGNQIIDNTALNGRNKSNEMLARHLQLFNDKLDINANVKGEITYKDLSDEELTKKIAEKEKKLKK